MNGRVIVGDVIMGAVIGITAYFVLISVWPSLQSTAVLVLVVTGCTLGVLFRSPGGALHRPLEAPVSQPRKGVLDRIVSLDLASVTVSPLLLKAIAAWLLGGFVLALLVPALHARGMELPQWLAWVVMLAALAVFLGPDVRRRFGSRS